MKYTPAPIIARAIESVTRENPDAYTVKAFEWLRARMRNTETMDDFLEGAQALSTALLNAREYFLDIGERITALYCQVRWTELQGLMAEQIEWLASQLPAGEA